MTALNSRIVYLNGHYIPQENAVISVMDRGFLFGDGVYEVIPVFNGNFFRLQQHLQRLQKSLDTIQLNFKVDYSAWENIVRELYQRNSALGKNQSIYLQITRGPAFERAHLFPPEIHPTVFAYSSCFKTVTIEELSLGAAAITVDDIRWKWCSVKAITLLANVLFAQAAKEAGAKEAILLRDGKALEGSSSNLFIVKEGQLKTPPKSQQILGGITRDLVLELAQQAKIPCVEADISEQELRSADEIWMTGSIKEILPIVLLDGKPVADGKVGVVWKKMIKLYFDYKQNMGTAQHVG